MRRPATADERRERLDESIVEAIRRAEQVGDELMVTQLRRDRLNNALEGFSFGDAALATRKQACTACHTPHTCGRGEHNENEGE